MATPPSEKSSDRRRGERRARGYSSRIRRVEAAVLGLLLTVPQASHDLTFTFRTRQPIVQVSVNGGAAVPFVVDTGATIHLVDEETARQARVAGTSDLQMHGGGQAGGTRAPRQAPAPARSATGFSATIS